MGICDDIDGWLCRPICESEADCTVDGELCYTVYVGEDRAQGFCRPPPPDEG